LFASHAVNQTIHDGKRVFFGRVTSFIVDKTKINRTLKKLKTDLVLVLFDPGDLPRLRSVDFTTLLAVGFNCSDSSTFRTVARTGPPSLSRRVPLIANQLTIEDSEWFKVGAVVVILTRTNTLDRKSVV
jgi:hypothetical protein